MADAVRDNNNVPSLLGVSSSDLTTPTRIAANPTTKALLIDSTSLYSGLDSRYVNTSGDTMTGSLNITGGNVTADNLSGTNTGDQDLTGYVLKSGSLTQLTTRSHTDLTSIGTNTHAQIDTFIGTTVPATYAPLASPVFTTQITTPSIISSGAVGITPASGSNLNITLATTGDLAVNTNQLYVDTSAGNVGIGTTAPASKLDVSPTVTNANLLANIYTDPLLTQSSNGTYYSRSLYLRQRINISSGVTNSGFHQTAYYEALRDQSTDQGTLTSLWGLNFGYGHYGATSRTTTTVYGLQLNSYGQGGTVTNMYGIHIPAFSGGGTVTNRWNLYVADTGNNYIAGNVGIGTTGPDSTLHISTAGTGSGTLNSANLRGLHIEDSQTALGNYSVTGITFTPASNHNSWIAGYSESSLSSHLIFGTDDAEKMRITTSGNVGIGTTAPGGLLEIEKNQNASTYLKVTNTDATDGSSRARIALTGGTVVQEMQSIAGDGGYFGTTSNHPFNIYTNGNTRLTVLAAGNVGIGTTSPDARLSVAQNLSGIGVGTHFSSWYTPGVSIGSIINAAVSVADGGAAIPLILQSNGGNVGIGTTAPTAKTHIDQSSTTGAIPVLTLDQADLSEEFIEFVGTVGAGNSIDTAAIGTYYGKVRVTVAGVGYKYIPLYSS
jgi:hypothetical protein